MGGHELGGATLAVRALAFGHVAVGLGLAMHVLAGGTAPSRSAVAGCLTGAVLLGLLLSSRELALPMLATALAASQAVLHLVFMATPDGMAMAAHPHPDVAATTSTESTVSMFVAHALAVFVTAWWLRRGEAALHRLARGLLTEHLRSMAAASWLLRGQRVARPVVAAPRPVPSAPPRRRPDTLVRIAGLGWRAPPSALGPAG